jgi:hypothetical protein
MGFSKTWLLLPFSSQTFAVIDHIIRPNTASCKFRPIFPIIMDDRFDVQIISSFRQALPIRYCVIWPDL